MIFIKFLKLLNYHISSFIKQVDIKACSRDLTNVLTVVSLQIFLS